MTISKNMVCDRAMDKICTGCRACEQVCPVRAITMEENQEGFRFPIINKQLCLQCGLCKKICPQTNPVNVQNRMSDVKAFAMQLLNRKALIRSTSGGVFYALAEKVLLNNGVVFGVTMDEQQHAVFCAVDRVQDLDRIQGSKYVASDTVDSYTKVENCLKEKRVVLFSGCPCQVAGLRAYLRKEYDNLLTVDIICHGTPSQKLFDVYISGLQELKGKKVEQFLFRDKSRYGWGVYWKYRIGKKSVYGGIHDNPYISTFIDGNANRECCYECQYVGISNRPGDFTLGDFWGVDIAHPEMASNDGVSAVIINTKKAEMWLSLLFEKCKYTASDISQVVAYNPSLVQNANRPAIRDTIYDGIDTKTHKQFVAENLGVSFKRVLKTKIRLLLPYKIRVMLKKVWSK